MLIQQSASFYNTFSEIVRKVHLVASFNKTTIQDRKQNHQQKKFANNQKTEVSELYEKTFRVWGMRGIRLSCVHNSIYFTSVKLNTKCLVG